MTFLATDTLAHFGASDDELRHLRFKEAAFNDMCRLMMTCSNEEWEELKARVCATAKTAERVG